MPKKSYAESVKNAQVMLAGLKEHADKLERRGIDTNFINNLEMKIDASITLNNEQEKLKAELKTKTSKLTDEMKVMGNLVAEAKKIVKLDLPKEQWLEFGILSKR